MFSPLFRQVALLSLSAVTFAHNDGTTDYVQRNLHTIQSIYNLTVYPNNAPILLQGGSAVPPGLFSQNARGRVTPVGNFTGFEDSIEYFFALAPTPQSNPAGVAIFEADVVEYTSGCANVAASVVYLKTGPVNATTGQLIEGSKTTALKQVSRILLSSSRHSSLILTGRILALRRPRCGSRIRRLDSKPTSMVVRRTGD